MKVVLVIALILHITSAVELNQTFNKTDPLDQNDWRDRLLNYSDWKIREINRTQWDRHPAFQATPWKFHLRNGTNSTYGGFNKTHIFPQKFNKSENQTFGSFGWRFNVTNFNKTRRDNSKWYTSVMNYTTPNGDVIIGQVGYLDRLLFNRTYLKTRRWWSGREKIVEYPKDLPGKYNWYRHEIISALRIYNKFYDGLASEAKVISGGVGYRYAKIKLSSPWNKGFHYTIQIFGK